DEDDETFAVGLSQSVNAIVPAGSGTATVTIIDNDATPSVSISNAGVTEGPVGSTTPLTFNVSLNAPSGRQVKVNWATTTAGSATAGTDFQAAGGTLTFAPGQVSQ